MINLNQVSVIRQSLLSCLYTWSLYWGHDKWHSLKTIKWNYFINLAKSIIAISDVQRWIIGQSPRGTILLWKIIRQANVISCYCQRLPVRSIGTSCYSLYKITLLDKSWILEIIMTELETFHKATHSKRSWLSVHESTNWNNVIKWIFNSHCYFILTKMVYSYPYRRQKYRQ